MLVLVELLPEVFTRLEVVEAELLGRVEDEEVLPLGLVVETELLGRVEDEVLLLGLVVEAELLGRVEDEEVLPLGLVVEAELLGLVVEVDVVLVASYAILTS